MEKTKMIELEQGWDFIYKGTTQKMNDIFQRTDGGHITVEDFELHAMMYQMCVQRPPLAQNYSHQLYERYWDSLQYFINSFVVPAVKEKEKQTYKQCLTMVSEAVNEWNTYKTIVHFLSTVFEYLDSFFIPLNHLPTLNEVSLRCFDDLVLQQTMLNGIRGEVIALISRDRDGDFQIDHHDSALLRTFVGILTEIGQDCYQDYFESPILEHTLHYYSAKAAIWFASDSCQAYMFKDEKCLEEEKVKISPQYLLSSSENKLLQYVEKVLLSEYESQILEKELWLCPLHMARMYTLFSRIPQGLEDMAQSLRDHVVIEGTSLIDHVEQKESRETLRNKRNKPLNAQLLEQFVHKVIELHDKYMQYVNRYFNNNSVFQKAVLEAFEAVCNEPSAGITGSKMLASFYNIILKEKRATLRHEDIQDTLEKVSNLLVYIHDKDLFEEFYKKKLANRLLYCHVSADDSDNEKKILDKFKKLFGTQFTYKMERMLNDSTLSAGYQKKFQKYLDQNEFPKDRMNFHVIVLTTSIWPGNYSMELQKFCPRDEMGKHVMLFEEFYQTKKKNAKLRWMYSQGECNITGCFDSGSVEIIVTPYQASALMLFNESDRLSYTEVKSQLNLTDEDTIKLLMSLSSAKHKILFRRPNTKTVEETDFFELHQKFSSDKMEIIRIPPPSAYENEKVKIEAVKKHDRTHAIDASIVNILKKHTNLEHDQLVNEITKYLKNFFKPDVRAIEGRIEEMTGQYLERVGVNPNMYKYLP